LVFPPGKHKALNYLDPVVIQNPAQIGTPDLTEGKNWQGTKGIFGPDRERKPFRTQRLLT